MHVLCLYGPRKSKPSLMSELRKEQYPVTLFDCNHLAHAIVLWQRQKCMLLYSFCFLLFWVWGHFLSRSPRGVVFGGAIYQRVFLHYKFGGLIFGGACTWRGLFSKFYGTFLQAHNHYEQCKQWVSSFLYFAIFCQAIKLMTFKDNCHKVTYQWGPLRSCGQYFTIIFVTISAVLSYCFKAMSMVGFSS